MMKMQDSLSKGSHQDRRSTSMSTSGGYQYSGSLANRTNLSRQSSMDRDDFYHPITQSPTSGYSSNNSQTNRLNRGQSPLTSRRYSDASFDKRSNNSSNYYFSSSLRSRSPSLDRELKNDSSNRRVLSRTNSLEEQGRYSYSTRPGRYTGTSRVARSSTMSSITSQTPLSSIGRYSLDSDSGQTSPSRPNRSRPSSPTRYFRTLTNTPSETTASTPTFRRYQPHHLVDSSKAII